MAFARNQGQAPSGVRYLGGAPGVGVAFTDDGVTLTLTPDQAQQSTQPATGTTGRKPKAASTTVALRFTGASRHPVVTGADRASGVVNDFHGADPARWHTNIPTFGTVVYHDLWPGIDALFSTRNGTLKYSFALALGADPDAVRLSYQGASHLAVGPRGDLAITAGSSVLHDQAPVSYQNTGGTRQRVATRYHLLGATGFGFTLARHSAGAPLTIDPGLDFSTYLGGTDGHGTVASTVGTDSAGHLYVIGQTQSANFPTTSGSFQPVLSSATPDFVVTKFDTTGSRLIYSTYVGGSNLDTNSFGRVDGDGSVYVTGFSLSTDFPTSATAYRRTPWPASNQSVAFKLNPAGTQLEYSTYLAPDLDAPSLATGTDGSVTIGGRTTSDFAPTTPGAFQSVYQGGEGNGYLLRLNPTGSDLVFATYLGVLMTDTGGFGSKVTGVAVDAAGATYALGGGPHGFPVTPGGLQPTKSDGQVALLVKLDPSGRNLDYATYLGDPPSHTDFVGGVSLAVDKTGNAYVAGFASPGSITPTSDAFQPQCPVRTCETVAQYGPTGSLVYSSYFSGTTDASTTFSASSITTDDQGRMYVVGATLNGSEIPVTPNAFSTTPGDFETSFFVAVFDKGTLLYSSYLGGTGSACLGAICGLVVGWITIAPDVSSGAVYLGGTTSATNFPTTPGGFQTSYPGGVDTGFAARLTLPDLSTAGSPPAAGPARR